jgi:hypothetical protein
LITYKAQQPAIEKHEIKQWFLWYIFNTEWNRNNRMHGIRLIGL